MEKGGHKPEWQLKIDNTYQDWKYNDVHKNIKSYFNEAHSKKHHSKTLKEQVEESSPISNDLSSLHDNVKNEEEGGKEKVFVRDSSGTIKFLGAHIEVPVDVADDVEVGSLHYP